MASPTPLAQNHSVALEVPDPQRYFFHDPGLTRTPGGALLVAGPQWDRPTNWHRYAPADRHLRITRSTDGVQTWKEAEPLPYHEGTPFVLGDRLFMFVQ